MKERPILFSAPMVRAILDGGKTQTRRAVRLPGDIPSSEVTLTRMQDGYLDGTRPIFGDDTEPNGFSAPNRFGDPGDRLWVKETHAFYSLNFEDTGRWHPSDRDVCCHYREGCPAELESRIDKWRPSIFMPRWASRITLEITGIRVERLQDITSHDARAEGMSDCLIQLSGKAASIFTRTYNVPEGDKPTADEIAVANYRGTWESINGDRSWERNPWVWVIEFIKK